MRIFWGLAALSVALQASGNPLIEFRGPEAAFSISTDTTTISSGSRFTQRFSIKHKRDDSLPKCSPSVTVIKSRDLDGKQVNYERNATLLLERMELPTNGDMDDFYEQELPKAEPIVDPDDSKDDLNTAIYEKYEDIIDKKKNPLAYSCGVQGLCGCTTLMVISRKGVYATHWWESISFAPEDMWRKPVKKDGKVEPESDDEVFQRTVLDPIKKGASKSGYQTHAQFKSDIADDFVKAYLVRPDTSWKLVKDGYRDRWDAIHTAISEVVPSLKGEERWQEIIYTRLDPADPDLFSKSNGKVLFKYDPGHKPDDDKPATKRKATLWVEGRVQPYHDDEW